MIEYDKNNMWMDGMNVEREISEGDRDNHCGSISS